MLSAGIDADGGIVCFCSKRIIIFGISDIDVDVVQSQFGISIIRCRNQFLF